MIDLALARFLGSLGTQALGVWLTFRVYQLTGSPLLTGLVGLTNFATTVFTGIYGGWLADRFGHRPGLGLFIVQLSLVVCALFSLALASFAADSLPGLLTLATMLTASRLMRSIFFAKVLAARRNRGESSNILSKWNTFSWQLALAGGPLVLGLGLDSRSISLGCFVAAAICLFRQIAIRSESERESLPPLESFWNAVCGFRGEKAVFQMWLTDAVVLLFASVTALFPFLLHDQGIDPQACGYLRSLLAFGGVATSLLVPSSVFYGDRRSSTGFRISLYLTALFTFLLPFAHGFWALGAVTFFIGAADGFSVIARDIALLETFAKRRMGSVTGVTTVLLSVSDDLGEFESGLLAASIGLKGAIFLGAAGAALGGVLYRPAWRETPNKTQFAKS